jgi:hypothetical protein
VLLGAGTSKAWKGGSTIEIGSGLTGCAKQESLGPVSQKA